MEILKHKGQDVEFIFNNGSLVAIDTPGLDDSLYNYEKIQNLKTLIIDYPTIKCILIVKKYNNFRMSQSLQDAIKVFIESSFKKFLGTCNHSQYMGK